jgi:predicted phage-related endonuclease
VAAVNAPANLPSGRGQPASHITYHRDLIQGSDEWLQQRCGLLTASEMKLILTPTLKVANNDKTRAHVYEIAAQRITQYVEPHYVSDDMICGHDDEIEARDLYSKTYAQVEQCGFITNNRLGFVIGCSPDGLIGDDGGLECKSRRQKFQIQTIATREVPDDFIIQVQSELFVTERQWFDFISYSGGLPMAVIRVEPDPEYQAAIAAAAIEFEQRVNDVMADYRSSLTALRNVPTERRIEQEMFV